MIIVIIRIFLSLICRVVPKLHVFPDYNSTLYITGGTKLCVDYASFTGHKACFQMSCTCLQNFKIYVWLQNEQ